MVQNLVDGEWDGANAAALLRTPYLRHTMAEKLAALIVQRKLTCLVMDFEALPPGAEHDYVKFLRNLKAARPRESKLAVTASAGRTAGFSLPFPAFATT